MHCAKCIIRSKLWQVDSSKQASVPSLAKVLVEHGKLEISVDELDGMIKNDEQTNLY